MSHLVSGREKGFSLMLLAMLSIVLVPLVGLAIDASVLYVVKARISAACDGASLAAARNLNVGQTMTQQLASARDRAQSFFEANLPSNYLGSTHGAPTIDIPTSTQNNVLTVTTTATANVNTYFMRMLGVNHVTVSATGTASRRNVNLMMVLDRSLSMDMSGSCEPMKTAATNFVNKFVDGRDNVGLITFATNTALAFAPASNFKSASQNIPTKISQIDCNDATSMAAAYWEGYKELVRLNQPGALNVIVLFTDGIPNGIYAKFPVRQSQGTRFGYSGASCGTNQQCLIPASSCSSPGTEIEGVIYAAGDLALTGDTRGAYMSLSSTSPYSQQRVNRSGCAYNQTAANGRYYDDRMRRDLAYIPDMDKNDNKIRGYSNPYYLFETNGVNTELAPDYPGKIRLDRPITITKASSNLIDHAAQRVRNRERDSAIGVVTFVIGLGTVDPVLMKRVANDPTSNIYVDDPELPDGKFILANNTQEMAEAFQRIASEVLRLSH